MRSNQYAYFPAPVCNTLDKKRNHHHYLLLGTVCTYIVTLKGLTTRHYLKCFFGVYAKFNIVCTTCTQKNYNLVRSKMKYLMRLTRKESVKIRS